MGWLPSAPQIKTNPLAKAVGEVLPFTAVKDQITEMVEKANWAQAANGFVESLVNKANISGV